MLCATRSLWGMTKRLIGVTAGGSEGVLRTTLNTHGVKIHAMVRDVSKKQVDTPSGKQNNDHHRPSLSRYLRINYHCVFVNRVSKVGNNHTSIEVVSQWQPLSYHQNHKISKWEWLITWHHECTCLMLPGLMAARTIILMAIMTILNSYRHRAYPPPGRKT